MPFPGWEPMSETPDSYEVRAEECVRLASLTEDELIRASILQLRQTYLRTAGRLRALAEGRPLPDYWRQ